MSVTGGFLIQSCCLQFVDFLTTTLGEGVKDLISVVDLDLAPKMALTTLCIFVFHEGLGTCQKGARGLCVFFPVQAEGI